MSLLRMLAVITLTVLLLSCGGGRKAPTALVPSSRVGGADQPRETTLSEALAELDALPTPEGVDEALFSELKSALAAQLRTQNAELGTSRLVSTPPTGEMNRVEDLAINGTQLTWSYRNVGDYSQDGIVNIQDITPLAVHFNETADPTNEWIDGNADTIINIQDITPLAANFMTDLARYAVESGATQDGNFTEVDSVPFSAATGEGRKTFSYALTIARDVWVRVVPYDGAGAPGEPSLPVYFPPPPNEPPVADLTAEPTSGVIPLLVDFNAGGSSDPDGTVVRYDYDWDGDGTYDLVDGGATPSYTYTEAGDYSATVRVTDDASATDTASIVITATTTENQPPVAALTADPTEGTAPLLVNFNATGSDDPDGTIVQYDYDWDTDGTYDLMNGGATPEYTYTEAGVYNATVRVTDDDSATDTEFIVITVSAGGDPPVINSVSPLSGEEGAPVTFNADVSGTPPFTYDWNFGGGVDPNTSTDESPSGTLGSANSYTLHIEVTNDFGTDARDFTLNIHAPGEEWSLFTVDNTKTVTYSSLALIGGNPAIAYFDDDADDLLYAYSENSDGTGSWLYSIVDQKGMGLGDVGTYCSLAEVAGRPAISYYEGAIEYNLKFAINPNADGSGTWTTYRVDTSGDAGWITSIAEVDGRPAIGYFSDDTTLDYEFAINAAADGSGAWTLDTVADVNSGMFADGRVLRVLAGRPAVAFYNWNASELQFAINANADGSGAWSASTVGTSMALFVSMASVNGLPAIAYRNFDAGGLEFAINGAADGSGTWSVYQVVPGISAQYTSVFEIGGLPAIAYRNYDDGALYYAVNDAADGSGTWSISQVDTNASYVSLIEVAGRATIAYARTDTNELKYALRNW